MSDDSMAMDVDEAALSLQSSTRHDVIRWQAPRPSCPALDALMTEASRPTKRAPKSNNQQYWDSGPSTHSSGFIASGGHSSSMSINSRPSHRVMALEQSIPVPFFNGSTADFLTYMESVRAKADENTRQMILTRKKATKQATSKEQCKVKEDRSSSNGSHPSRNIGRVEKGHGKGKEPLGRRSLPNLSAPPEHVDKRFSMAIDADADLPPMDVDMSFSIPLPPPTRTPSNTPPTRVHMPPPPVPIKRSNSSFVPERTHISSDTVTISSPATSIPLPIKAYPLLSPKTQSQLLNQPRLTQSGLPTPPPRPSQSSRPPVLGMRRTTTHSSLNRSQTTTLPTKQKGFKPPLARPPPPTPRSAPSSSSAPRSHKRKEIAQLNDANQPIPVSTRSHAGGQRRMDGADKRSSSPAAEADSSYGELSFDMDALEETMKLYD